MRDRDLEERFVQEIEDLGIRMRSFGLVITPEIKCRLRRFSGALLRWNRHYGFLSRKDIPNLVSKHIGASLGVLLLIDEDHGTRWADVGTGAGFPGLVLKMWNPEQQIVLIESSHRKCVFLQSMVRELGLGPTQVLSARVEAMLMRGELVGSFQLLLLRAVSDVSATLRDFGPLLQVGGKILTFKGPGWRTDVDRAISDGNLAEGRYELESVMAVPWAPGRIIQIRKADG